MFLKLKLSNLSFPGERGKQVAPYLSCQNTHSCLRGYGLSFFNIVIRNSALFPSAGFVAGVPPLSCTVGAEEEAGAVESEAVGFVVAASAVVAILKQRCMPFQ